MIYAVAQLARQVEEAERLLLGLLKCQHDICREIYLPGICATHESLSFPVLKSKLRKQGTFPDCGSVLEEGGWSANRSC